MITKKNLSNFVVARLEGFTPHVGDIHHGRGSLEVTITFVGAKRAFGDTCPLQSARALAVELVRCDACSCFPSTTHLTSNSQVLTARTALIYREY